MGEMPFREDGMGQDKCEGGLGEIERANKGSGVDETQCMHLKVTQSV